MSSRTPVAVAVVVVRGCRVAIFRRFVPNVFGSVCPRSASWCGSSHIRLPSGAAAAAARAVFFVWVFYTRTVRVFGERLNEALAPFELLPISIYTEMDPDWEEYKDMYEMKEWAVD